MTEVVAEPAMGSSASAFSRPTVSIIIPAFNAAKTLDRALESLRKQTATSWEALVVDDGSHDGTAYVANSWAAKDARVRSFRKENGGASSARNVGMTEARGEWIGFLDSDDWFDARFLEKLLATAERHPDAGVVYCDFALVDNDGGILEEQRVPDMSDPFGTLARSCVLSVHCALTRSEVMQRAGNFDESLALNEDWDLWQRIARTGVPFKGIRDILAFYYTRPESLSRKPILLATDGLEVIERCCRADPNVPSADPRYADGLPDEDRAPMQLDWILMCAANAIALGENGVPYLDLAPDLDGAWLQPQSAAATVLGALAFARCTDARGLAPHWTEIEPALDVFWTSLNARIQQPRAVETARFTVFSRVWGSMVWSQPFQSDILQLARVDIDKPLVDVESVGRDVLIVEICKGAARLGWLELPGAERVTASVLSEAIGLLTTHLPDRRALLNKSGALLHPGFWLRAADESLKTRGWGLKARIRRPERIVGSLGMRARATLGRTLSQQISGGLRIQGSGASPLLDRIRSEEANAVLAVPATPFTPANEQAWRDVEVNSPEYWDQVFENANPWAYDSRYEQTKYEYTLDMVGDARPKSALELACAEGHFTVQLADKVETLLATDISTTAIKRAAERCADHPNVRFDQLDFFNNPIPGSYDLITCSEVLYECGSMPRLRAIARNIFDHLNPGGAVVMAHVIEVSEERHRSGFDWDGVFGAKTIAEVFGEIEGLSLEAQIESEIYRIHRFRKTETPMPTVYEERPIVAPPEPEYAAYVAWGGAVVTRKEAAVERAVAIPVLMYHRVAGATDGPASLAQYRVTPEAFEAQIRWLRQNGYRGVTPTEVASAIEDGRALPGRPVLLTFDDGYRDFATTAWPLLQHYGLPATVAVVTDKVGGTSDWDARYGETAPLMNWEEIQRVAAQGATIASHSASHRAFPAISASDVLREAVRSALALAKAIGVAPDTIAYPYGTYDDLSGQACAMAGYRMGLGTGPGTATLLSPLMHVPRIDVNGFDDLPTFIRSVTAVDPETGKARD